MVLNYILIVLMIALLGGGIYFVIRQLNESADEEEYENIYTEKHIIQMVAQQFSQAMKINFKEMNLSRRDLELKNKTKAELRQALKESAAGNSDAKNYVKTFIRDIIRESDAIKINEYTINSVIHFDNPDALRPKDKFQICMYIYHKKYGMEGFTQMIEDYDLAREKKRENGRAYYEISNEDAEDVYYDLMSKYRLTFDDELNILSQRIFEQFKGFGVIDMLFDSLIDEVDCGVSGIPKDSYVLRQSIGSAADLPFSYESCWITYHGTNIRVSCLPFDSQQDLMRVCRNIYKYNAPKALSKKDAGIISTMKDGSRILVVRPPFSDSWAFFARKFDSTPSIAPEDLYKTDKNWIIPITMVKWIMIGLQNAMVTGDQGSGKTTFLKSIISFYPEWLTIRIQEKAFEMNPRFIYPNRNIVVFQETENYSMQTGLEYQKKTNGLVNVFGEIAELTQIGGYLQTCRVASLQGIGTNHSKTTPDLIRSFAIDGETEETVAQTIHFDIHTEREPGHRYCSYINEIIPIRDRSYPTERNGKGDAMNLNERYMRHTIEFQERETDRQAFKVNEIVRYENGSYVLVNMPSDDMMKAIALNIGESDREEFARDMEMLRSFKTGRISA